VVVIKYIFNINKKAGYKCKINFKISNEVSYRVKKYYSVETTNKMQPCNRIYYSTFTWDKPVET